MLAACCFSVATTVSADAQDGMRPVPRFAGTSIRDKRTESQKAGAASGLHWRVSSEVTPVASPPQSLIPFASEVQAGEVQASEVQAGEPEKVLVTAVTEIAPQAIPLQAVVGRETILPVLQAKYQITPATPSDEGGLMVPPGLQPAPTAPSSQGLSLPSGAPIPTPAPANPTKPLPDFFTDPSGDEASAADAKPLEAAPLPGKPVPAKPNVANELRLPTPQVIPVPAETDTMDDSGESLTPPSEKPQVKPEKAPNPFDRTRSDDERSADEADKRRLEDFDMPLRPKPKSNDSATERRSTSDPLKKTADYSCDRFRESISKTKIQDVSLDISPPFRPDIIELDKFENLKNKFDESQQVRDWQSIDGRKLGRGRLRDLAYEKVVIETEFGTIEQLPMNRVSEADLEYLAKNWGLPQECLIEQASYTPRSWQATTVTWKASNLCHKPLYFEEVNLERYGHDAGPFVQPVVSTAHFFANIAVLPYKMGVHGPSECQYALGYYRPGNCAPWIIPPVPLSLRGALYQVGAVAGAIVVYP